MEILIIGRTIGRIQLAENSQSERENVFNGFPGLFENNETKKDTGISIQLKQGHCRDTAGNKKQNRYHYTYKKM